MTGTKVDIEKFDRKNDFALWQGKSQSEYIDEFYKLVGDLAAIHTAISDDDQPFLLLTFLPSSYDSFVETLLYGRDTLKLEDMLATLNSRELQKMTEAKGIITRNLKVLSGIKIRYPVLELMAMTVLMRDYLVDFEEYDSGNILLSDDRECHVRGREGFTVKIQLGKIKVIKGSLMALSGIIRANCSGLSKVLWAEDTTMSTYLVNKAENLGYKGLLDKSIWKLLEYTASVLYGIPELSDVCIRLYHSIGRCGMLDKFDRGLQTEVYVFVDFDYTIGRSITVMGRSITSGLYDTYEGYKRGYSAKGTYNKVRIQAKDSSGYCYRCLIKGYPWFKVPA
ncbi:hypothetical protein Tco_1368853 [Tanacetum coccineum]